jgi:hypothetical protein
MTKLSTQTLEILKNFASINSNLIVKSGEALSTISEAKNIMASAEITELFETTFGIYDLNEFINMFSLMQDPELDFTPDSVIFKSGRSKASYRFADQSILTTPKSKINMPTADVSVTIGSDLLGQIRKAAGILGHTIVSIGGENGVITLSVVDPKNSTANSFSVILDDNNASQATFDFQFLIANIKVIPGDYSVNISSKWISHWLNNAIPVNYYIALEKTSSYNA